MALSNAISGKLVRALIRKKVRQQLNEILADLKREFSGSLEKQELHEIAMETLSMMREFSNEFVEDMEKRYKSGEAFKGGAH